MHEISIKMYISFILNKVFFWFMFYIYLSRQVSPFQIPVATVISGFEPLPYWHTRCTD